jgi:hypothetical protein
MEFYLFDLFLNNWTKGFQVFTVFAGSETRSLLRVYRENGKWILGFLFFNILKND